MTAEGTLAMVWPEKVVVLPGGKVEPERRMLPDVSLVMGWLLTEAMGAGLGVSSFLGLGVSPAVPPLVPLLVPSLLPVVPPVWPVVPLVPLFSLVSSVDCCGKRVIGAVEGSLLPESVPDCFSVGEVSDCSATELFAGSTTASTGSEFEFEFEFEFELAFSVPLSPVAGEPSFCATTEGLTGSTIGATGLDFAVVGVAVPALLLPGSFAFALPGSALIAALVEAATGDFKVAAGDGGAFAASGFVTGVGAGARAVAFCSTRGGS